MRQAAHDNVVPVLIALIVIGLWGVPIGSSLWLDETGTHWFVEGSFSQTIDRALSFQGQSPLYYMIVWAVTRVFGLSEIALRLPSLISMLVATWLLYRLGKRLFDRETGRFAALIFAVSSGIPFTAIEARSYAMALAALIGATLALVRWLDEGRPRDGIAYALTMAATFYLHYLFAIAILPHILYVAYRSSRGTKAVSGRQLALVTAFLGILLMPSLPNLLDVQQRGGALSVPGDISIKRFLAFLAPPPLVAGFGIGLLLVRRQVHMQLDRLREAGASWFFVGCWLTMPPLVLLGISRFTETQLTFERYFLSAVPGMALFVAAGIRSLGPERVRRVVVLGVVICSILASAGRWIRFHGDEDWRGTAATLNRLIGDESGVPVLVEAGYIEANQIDWLRDPVRSRYLMAPLSPYPMRGMTIPTPFVLDAPAKRYLDDITKQHLVAPTRFFLVARWFTPYRSWLEASLKDEGFSARTVYASGLLRIFMFERPP